jgi:hypothetical protein
MQEPVANLVPDGVPAEAVVLLKLSKAAFVEDDELVDRLQGAKDPLPWSFRNGVPNQVEPQSIQ